MDASFGSGIALDADSLARAFAGAGIRLSALAADGQAAHVSDAAVAFDALQPLEVHADLASQVAFDDVLAVLNGVDDLRELLFGQILRANGWVDVGLAKDLDGVGWSDAVNVAQGDIDALIRRNFYTNDACHKSMLLFSLIVAVEEWIVG